MQLRSVWQQNSFAPIFPQAEKDLETEVIIIGGGMAGVLCAAALQERNTDCVLLESETVGSGVTARTTAVLSVQNELLFRDLASKHGKENTALYLKASLQAIERYRAYAERFPCDMETIDAVTYSLHDAEKMKRDAAFLRSIGYPAEFTAGSPLPFPVAGAVRFPEMAQFHPLKLLYSLAKELHIFEHSKALRLEGTTVFTERAKITAKKVIVATHFPFIDRYGFYFLKLHQRRSFVIAYENTPKLHAAIMDEAENGIYLRNYGNYLLIGGGDRRTGKKGNGFETVRAFAKRYYPNAREAILWSNQDCVTLDSMPYIGAYRSGNTDVLVATGFDGWGMTGSMIAADVLADLAIGKKNPYASVFAPNRSLPFLPLLKNIGESLIGLLTPTVPRCSHMGCALHWNKSEGTWDCPCHGSRYDKNGKVLTNPANRDIRTKRS